MTINEYDFPEIRPEIPRNGYGQYVLPHPSEPGRTTAFTRATTVSGSLDDKYGVQRWKERLIVQGLATKPEILAEVDFMADDRDIRDTLQRIGDEAFELGGGNVASTRGTQLHSCTELVDAGVWTIDDVPAEYRNEIRAYRDALDKYGIVTPAEGIERVVYHAAADIVGTADRLPVVMSDGTRFVGDVKSGRDLSYGWLSISTQLAIYSGASAMLSQDEEGNWQWEPAPVVDEDYGLVFHVPVDQGKCTIYLVDLKLGRDVLMVALDVREARKRVRRGVATQLPLGKYGRPETVDDGALPAVPPQPNPFATHPDVAPAASPDPVEAEIYTALDACTTPEDMGAVWERFADRWTELYTAYGLARLADNAGSPAGDTSK